jgi:hypothetical protein
VNLEVIYDIIRHLKNADLFLVCNYNYSCFVASLDELGVIPPEKYSPLLESHHIVISLREDLPLIDIRSDSLTAIEDKLIHILNGLINNNYSVIPEFPIDIKGEEVNARRTDQTN